MSDDAPLASERLTSQQQVALAIDDDPELEDFDNEVADEPEGKTTKGPPVVIDRSVGRQEYLSIGYRKMQDGRWEYAILVYGPISLRPGYHLLGKLEGSELSPEETSQAVEALLSAAAAEEATEVLYNIKATSVRDKLSIAILVASEMAKDPHFCFGRDQLPYRWVCGAWELAEKWLLSLDYSMHSLIRTSTTEGSGVSLAGEAWSAFRAKSSYPAVGADLSAFGDAPGVALLNGVVQMQDDGSVVTLPLDPKYLNRYLIPCHDVMALEGRTLIQEDLARDVPQTKLGKFLQSTLTKPGHLETLRKWFGYHLVLAHVPNAEKLMYIWGPGGNGKSQLAWLLRGLLGEDAVANLRLSDLRQPAALELLNGKVAMVGSEASASTDVETLKALVSREPLTCNPKFRKPFTVFPECLVTQCSNHPPEFPERSGALARRFIVLHLENVFTDTGDHVQDIAKVILEEEYSLLVGWALHGAFEVLAEGRYVAAGNVVDDSRTAVELGNPIAEFLSQALEFGAYEVALAELHRVFERWETQNGRRPATSQRAFREELLRQAMTKKQHIEVREKATLYEPQRWPDERTGDLVHIEPALRGGGRCTIVLGVRVADGVFGEAIGVPIHPDRREVEAWRV